MSTENTPDVFSIQSQPQPKKFWRKVLCWLPVVIVVAVPVWYFCLHTTPLEISTGTTYVTAPLTADGKRIDYFLAMEERYYPPEMQTDDNGYRMIVRACGDLAERYDMVQDKDGNWKREKIESDEALRLQTYEKLGLDPNVKPTLKLESPDTVFQRLRSEQLKVNANAPDELSQKYYRPYLDFWTFDDFPILETWLAENTAGLDLLGEAVRKPAFQIPFVRKNENSPIVNMFFMSGASILYREFARALSGRARYRIGIGDIDGAIYDKMTIHYLARHATRSGGVVGGLVGIAIEGVAAATAIGANPNHPLTKEQLEKLMTEIDALPPRFTFAECIETERFFSLGNFQSMYWDSKSVLGYKYNLYPFPSWYCDFNIALRGWNKMFDTLVDGTFTDYKVEYNPLSNLTVHGRSEVFAIVMFNLAIPSMQASRESWRRADCVLNMQRLTLALLLYEKEHGSLPDGDWRTAITPYLGDKPEQYFHCPSSESSHGHIRPVTHVYALIKYDGRAPSTPDTMLLVETIAQNVNEDDGTVPDNKTLFEGFHTGGYNASFRNGAIRFQPVPVMR